MADGTRVACKRRGLKIMLVVGTKKGEGLMRRLEVGPDPVVMLNAALQEAAKAAGVEYISAWHTLCNPEGCLARIGPAANDVVTTDIVHLSDAGSNFLVEKIRPSLFP